jgi:predicted TIM-barrel fold metal-dependent hydrolase
MIFDIRINPPTTVAPNPPGWEGYDKNVPHMKNAAPFLDQPFSKFVGMLTEAGVTRGMLIVGPYTTKVEDQPKHIKSLMDQYPGKFVGGVTVWPQSNLMKSVQEVERAVKEFGMKTILLRPFSSMLYANDRRFYPIYAKCAELGAVVSIVVGVNFTGYANLQYADPMPVDSVAAEFPDLKIIMTHSGWPWAAQAVAVAWKNPNVYIDITGIGPRFIAMDGAGYEPIFKFGNTILQDKILWGTDWPLTDQKRSIQEVMELPLKKEVKEKWLYKNAMALFGLKD